MDVGSHVILNRTFNLWVAIHGFNDLFGWFNDLFGWLVITNVGVLVPIPSMYGIWAIYYKSLTQFKAILGGIPLLNHHLGWPRLRSL